MTMETVTRRGFLGGAGATLGLVSAGYASVAAKPEPTRDIGLLQDEIAGLTPEEYVAYCKTGDLGVSAALARLDAAFDKVLAEVRQTVVTDLPAVWFVYNMGFVVKTRERCFSIDLRHVRAPELAPYLDFAIISHNHGDHYTEEFYRAMNGKGKTVISNFKDNYGAADWRKGGSDWAKDGGYCRPSKSFRIGDVEIKTALTDHNGYLVDYTTASEITIGGRFRIFHTGDCSNVEKLNPAPNPDMWILHPACGLKVEDGVRKFRPALTVIAHLNELSHGVASRWTWSKGNGEAAKAEKAGSRAIVPLWGDRIL